MSSKIDNKFYGVFVPLSLAAAAGFVAVGLGLVFAAKAGDEEMPERLPVYTCEKTGVDSHGGHKTFACKLQK